MATRAIQALALKRFFQKFFPALGNIYFGTKKILDPQRWPQALVEAATSSVANPILAIFRLKKSATPDIFATRRAFFTALFSGVANTFFSLQKNFEVATLDCNAWTSVFLPHFLPKKRQICHKNCNACGTSACNQAFFSKNFPALGNTYFSTKKFLDLQRWPETLVGAATSSVQNPGAKSARQHLRSATHEKHMTSSKKQRTS